MTESISHKSASKPRARAASAILAGAKAVGATEVHFREDGTVVVKLADAPPTASEHPANTIETAEDVKALL